MNRWIDDSSQLESSKAFFRGSISMANVRDLGPRNPWNLLWNLMKSSEIHENRWKNKQLESSEGFFRGIISMANVRDLGPRKLWKCIDSCNPRKTIKFHENALNPWSPRKSMKIDGIASQPAPCKPRHQIRWIDESMIAASWNRVKVSLGASFRWQTSLFDGNLGLRNPWKSMKIDKIASQPASPAARSNESMNRW